MPEQETAVILSPIRGDVLASRNEWIAERDALVAQATDVQAIATAADLDSAGAVMASCRKHIKNLETARKEVTTPIDAVKKQIMDDEKRLRSPLEAEANRVKALCDAYATEQANKAEESRLAAAESLASENIAAALFGAAAMTAPVVRVEAPRAAANRMVTRWSFQIVDPAAVPREFCTPDETKIRAWMQAQAKLGSTPSLPGVTFDKTVSVETK